MPRSRIVAAMGPLRGSGGCVVGDVGAQVADDEFDGVGDDVRDALEGQAVAVVQRPRGVGTHPQVRCSAPFYCCRRVRALGEPRYWGPSALRIMMWISLFLIRLAWASYPA